MSCVRDLCVSTVDPLHSNAEVRSHGAHEQVIVGREEAVRKHDPATELDRAREQLKEALPGEVVAERCPGWNRVARNVVDQVGAFDTRHPGHQASVAAATLMR